MAGKDFNYSVLGKLEQVMFGSFALVECVR